MMKLFTFLLLLLSKISLLHAVPFGKNVAAFAAIKPGDKLPWTDMFWNFPSTQTINLPEYCGDRNVIIVGLPAAFTASSAMQIPSYIDNQDALKDLGVEEVIFYCVNDSAVMGIWMDKLGLAGTMSQMFGDPAGEFTKACGMEMADPGPATSVGLLNRSKSFAMHVVNNIVQYVAVSESDEDPACDAFHDVMSAPAMIKAIEANLIGTK